MAITRDELIEAVARAMNRSDAHSSFWSDADLRVMAAAALAAIEVAGFAAAPAGNNTLKEHFGTGWFKWLSLFRRPMIKRSLVIEFSKETGRRKGSWKGGTIGHSIEMLPGELHETAFRSYCAARGMTFVGMLATGRV